MTTGFEASDDFMGGIMARFVKDPAGWLKGPNFQLGLPFTPGAAGKQFYKSFETQFPSHLDQEAAWQRLSSQHLAQSTLVATRTGSGKTECFMYPVLDHRAYERDETHVSESVVPSYLRKKVSEAKGKKQ